MTAHASNASPKGTQAMTFTDAELDELVSLLRCEGTNEPVQAADAITYLRKELRIVSLQYLSDEGQIADRIEAAVKAERERCVGIAHQFGKAAFDAMGENPDKKDAVLALVQGFAALAIVMGMEPK